MLKPILATTMIVLLSACAHQSGGNNSASDSKDSPTRVDDAFEDGHCDSHEARDPNARDCQQQSAQQKRQRQNALPTEELLNDHRIGDFGRELDRGLPTNLRSGGLGL